MLVIRGSLDFGLILQPRCVCEIEMYSINRQVAVIKPKEPYVDWINSLPGIDEPCDIEGLNNDCTALLSSDFRD